MSQQEELTYRLSNINIERAVKEYLQEKMGKSKLRYNPEAFSAENIYDSKKLWNDSIVKKPTLLDLEKYDKLAIDRVEREDVKRCWEFLRSERNKKLCETDWTQFADVKMKTKDRSRYRDYREYIRNVPNKATDKSVINYKIEEFNEWLLRKHPEDFDA